MTKSVRQKRSAKPRLKKAPQAPKRFKSNYILFFIHVQDEIKKSLPQGCASAPEVSKKASEMWRNLSPEARLHWDQQAEKEKERYSREKKLYTGPWQVPHKRAKKNPNAPKRNPSAFLLFSLKKRKELKESNPTVKNTDISRLLGGLWRSITEEEKRPHIEQEESERKKYKAEMIKWRKDQEEKEEATKEANSNYHELFQISSSSHETNQDAPPHDVKQYPVDSNRTYEHYNLKYEGWNNCSSTIQAQLPPTHNMCQFPQRVYSSETRYPQSCECFDQYDENGLNCDTSSHYDQSIWHEGARYHDQGNDVHLNVEEGNISDIFLYPDMYEPNAFEPIPITNIDLGRN